MVMNRQGRNPLDTLAPLLSARELCAMQEEVENTYVSQEVVNYIVALIGATRSSEHILRGASPRATLSVTAMAKAIARLRGRDFVIPKDVQEVFAATVAHRLQLSPKAEGAGLGPHQVLKLILGGVSAPRLR